ncbi:hypothetical protein MSIMFI_05478 [Mycobacterium simulans]|nr:hypothetical protein MSIMFI_05478 [Mycobacterium simulans]
MLRRHPQTREHLVFAWVCGGKDLGPKVVGDLNGGLPDPASAGVDEHSLAGTQPRQLDQGDIGSQKRHGHRRGVGKRQAGRDGDDHAVIRHGRRRKGVVGE